MITLAEIFWWESLKEDVESFLSSRIHSLSTEGGERTSQALGSTLHGNVPNEIIYFDYCYVGKGKHGHHYILILKDDLTSYSWLSTCEQTDV